MNNSELKRVFLEAADTIEKNGLAKCSFIDGNYCACVTGAIGLALGYTSDEIRLTSEWAHTPDYQVAEKTLFTYLLVHNQVEPLIFANISFGIFNRVTSWNDNPDRTAEEVVSTLRDLAETLDG